MSCPIVCPVLNMNGFFVGVHNVGTDEYGKPGVI